MSLRTFVSGFAIAVASVVGAQSASAQKIPEVAAGAGQFKTLVAAVKAAGLADTLSGPGPFTVFAPTDDAFAKLPKGTVETLLKPRNKKKLVALLTYHVVSGKILAGDIKRGTTHVKTVNGRQISVTKNSRGVKVDGVTVVKADVKADNGVIHVINRVLMPK